MHVPGGGGREISSIPCNDPWRKGRLAEVGVQSLIGSLVLIAPCRNVNAPPLQHLV